jgi:hypothetical protein
MSLDLAHWEHGGRRPDHHGDALPRKYDALRLKRTLTDNSFNHSQLTRRRNAEDAYFSGHALSRIVRLTVETNLLTSMGALGFGCNAQLSEILATNGVIALLMVAIFPVRDLDTVHPATDSVDQHRTRIGSFARKYQFIFTSISIPPPAYRLSELLFLGNCQTAIA